MIHFDCPHCGKQIRLKEELAGRKGSCPHCRQPIQAPPAGSSPPPARPARGTRPHQSDPPAPIIDSEPVPQPAYDDEPTEAVAPRAPVAQRGKKHKKSSSRMPLVLGAAGVGGTLVVAVVAWVLTRGDSGSTPARGTADRPAPPPAAAAPPAAATTPTATAPANLQSLVRNDLFAYMTPQMDALAGARVRDALAAPEKTLAKDQLESTLRPLLARTGFQLAVLDEVVLGSTSQSDETLIALRTIEPLDPVATRRQMNCSPEVVTIGPAQGYALPAQAESEPLVVCFPDSKTMLVGSKNLVQQSLEGSANPARPAVLASVSQGTPPQMWVVAQMGLLTSQVHQLMNFGVSESMFLPSLAKIGHVAIGFDLSQAIQLRVAIECASETDARAIRGAVDVMRVAIRDAERKRAAEQTIQPGGEGGAPGPGGRGPGPGGMPGGPPGGGAPPGGPRAGMGPGMGGPNMGGPGRGGPGFPGGPGMSGGPMPGGGPGGNADSSPGAVWEATEVKLAGNQILVTLPPVKVTEGSAASPLDLFGSATQSSFARSAVGSDLFPGPLRRTSLALRSLADQDGSIPPGTIVVEKYPRPIQRVSWLAALLPHLGYQELHDTMDLSEEWTNKKNLPAAGTIIDAFLDPAVPQRRWKGLPFEGVALTHFAGMAGVGSEAPRLPKDDPRAGIFGYDRKTAISDVRDGAAHTIMMIQVRDVFGPWIQGGGATVRAAQSQPYIGATGGFGSPGDTGVMTIFADGSVRFIHKDIDPKIFEALCTINGQESVDLDAHAPRFSPRRGTSP